MNLFTTKTRRQKQKDSLRLLGKSTSKDKNDTRVVVGKNSRLTKRPSKLMLGIFSLVFAVIGGWLIILSFAAPPQIGTAPIDPAYQQVLPFGVRSHWVQPWRAYLDTWPAQRLRSAIGVNFNVNSTEVDATAQLLGSSGFKKARIEVGWANIDYTTNTLTPTGVDYLRTRLTALKNNGIRPLILLYGHHGYPAPSLNFQLKTVAPAAKDARTVRLDAASISKVVPGKTGFSSLTTYKSPEILITAVSADGTATLAKPLPKALEAGNHQAATLKYEPFTTPKLANGSPNPRFEATMAGWLQYIAAVTGQAKAILGNDQFDIEVWNELTFGSDFLSINNYYDPAPADVAVSPLAFYDIMNELPKRTVSWIRNPANGVSNIGVGNGFSNQTPFLAGGTSPLGLTALDKHPYAALRNFPADSQSDTIRTVDAQGNLDGSVDSSGKWQEGFIPTYRSNFPEYYLTAIQTETLIRDLSPFTENIYGQAEHGRYAAPPGGTPPAVWVTEVNMDQESVAPAAQSTFQAKAALRYLVSYVNKGISTVDFYAAKAGSLSIVEPGFFEAIAAQSTTYPGDAAGGKTMAAFKRLTQAMPTESITTPRSLSLKKIEDFTNNAQFQGDGTAKHPPLYNRDVTTFFPFQVNNKKFVAAAYVMTRDLGKVYNTTAPDTDPNRYNMPAETYRFTIGGINARPSVNATDPLTGASVPVQLISYSGTEAVIQLPLTDSPRLITIDETPIPPTLGDINGDGKVDSQDLAILATNWSTTGRIRTQGDLSGDGKVDSQDLAILASGWGK